MSMNHYDRQVALHMFGFEWVAEQWNRWMHEQWTAMEQDSTPGEQVQDDIHAAVLKVKAGDDLQPLDDLHLFYVASLSRSTRRDPNGKVFTNSQRGRILDELSRRACSMPQG